MKKTLAIILAVVILVTTVSVTALAAYTAPAEVGTANEIGVWPMAAGQYDPMLDGQGIKDGTNVYGFYEFDFATFVITPHASVPGAIKGYTKVSKPADMTDGTFCVLTVPAADPNPAYDYVLVMGEPKAAAVTPEPKPEPKPEPAPSGLVARPTASTVYVNGEVVAFDAYNIKDNNYFKLRDLAFVLNASEKQFEVGFDSDNNAIALTSDSAYSEVGGEMVGKGSGNKTPTPTTSKVFLDGKEVAFTAYNIDGNNYFMLRDIGAAIDFAVDWDGANNAITIDTAKGYTAP